MIRLGILSGFCRRTVFVAFAGSCCDWCMLVQKMRANKLWEEV